MGQARILIVREANFEEANLDSRRQILTRFLRDLHASPGPDTPPDSTLTGPPLFRWSFISASNGLANRPDLLVARAHVAAFVLRVLRVDRTGGAAASWRLLECYVLPGGLPGRQILKNFGALRAQANLQSSFEESWPESTARFPRTLRMRRWSPSFSVYCTDRDAPVDI